MRRELRTWACVAFMGLTICSAGAGCAGLRRGPAVPKDLQDQAIVAGLPGIRTWGDMVSPEFRDKLAVEVLHRKQALWAATGRADHPPAGSMLAISGGGANGAFGAGLLCGWTAKGDRPEFEVVTGISTGALIAPFAFLGSDYDGVLREVYTTVSTSSILKKRGLLGALTSDALSDNGPLWKLLGKYIDQPMLDAIAAEYGKGRLLLIGTVNLDARRSVVWNIGAIAASKHPRALELVRSLLVASAAIPAAFPPVMIDVEAGGRKFQEMHVDGGCLNEVFLYPTSFVPLEVSKGTRVTRERRLYVIRNSRLDPDWSAVERQTFKIAERAISALIYSQGVGDLDRMFMTARRDKMEFNLAYIPENFQEVSNEPFDREYMLKLFDVAFALSRNNDPWLKTPPGFVEPEKD